MGPVRTRRLDGQSLPIERAMGGDEGRRIKKIKKRLTKMGTDVLIRFALVGLIRYNSNGPLACAFQCLPEQRGLTGLVV